jgi:hypothetical protein
MARLIKQTNKNYTNVSNQLIRDKRLSWKARGIFVYLWSQADNWQFYVSEVATHATDGKDSLASGLKELEKYGYLKRKNRLTVNGKISGMEWILSDSPLEGNPVQRETRPTVNPPLRINNNKNYQQQELPNNKKTNSASPSNALSASQLQDEFEELWKEYPNKKGKKQAFNHYKSWRKASKKHTKEYILARLAAYKKYCEENADWYHPQNGSTWFNGRFDDDYTTNDSTTSSSNFVIQDDGHNPLDGVNEDDLPF